MISSEITSNSYNVTICMQVNKSLCIFQIVQQVKLLLRELCVSFTMNDPPDLEQKLSFNAVPPPSPAAGAVAPDAKHVSELVVDNWY